MFVERLQEFLAIEDFAVAATWTPSTGGPQQTANVLFDSPDQQVLGDSVMSTEYMITLRASDFTGLKYGETVGVASASWKVREVRLIDDGVLKQVTLSKV